MGEPVPTAKKRSKPRRIGMVAYAVCGSHGKPWCHLSGPSSHPGQLAIFESARAAHKAHGGRIHEVKIYVERESFTYEN